MIVTDNNQVVYVYARMQLGREQGEGMASCYPFCLLLIAGPGMDSSCVVAFFANTRITFRVYLTQVTQ